MRGVRVRAIEIEDGDMADIDSAFGRGGGAES